MHVDASKSDVEIDRCLFNLIKRIQNRFSLHQRAVSLGANAVVNIRSNFKNNVETSDTDYTCGAGGVMAGVALIGDFVKVE